MKIKVLKNTKAAKDKLGIEAFDYQAGETYEIFDELANVFVSQGWGVEEKTEKEKQIEIEEKAINNLENKAVDNLENKAIDNLNNKKKGKK